MVEENQSKEQQSLLTSQHSQVQKFSNHSNKSQQQEKLKLKQKQKIYNQQINNQ